MTNITQASQSSSSLTNVMPALCIARVPEPETQDCDPEIHTLFLLLGNIFYQKVQDIL